MNDKVFEAPRDHQWVLKKQRPTQFDSNKNRPGGDKPEWKKKEEQTNEPEAVS